MRMSPECAEALAMLKAGSYTCVVRKEDRCYTSHSRGVRPLLDLYDANVDCTGFVAADKVVGRAAAYLYILLGVGELYAFVISESARELLVRHGIAVSFDKCVAAIRNRDNTGFCPMESCVMGIDDPDAALSAIRLTLQSLSSQGSGKTK